MLWKAEYGRFLDLIKIAYGPFEVRPKMLSCGRLAFVVLSVTLSEVCLMIFYLHSHAAHTVLLRSARHAAERPVNHIAGE